MKEEIFDIIKNSLPILAPILSSILSVYATGKISLSILEKKFLQKLQIKDAKTQQKLDNEKYVEEKKNKEIIINKLQYIKVHNSITMNYIKEELEYNESKIYKDYLKTLDIFCFIYSKMFITFPRYIDQLNEINGLCNQIWGNEQNYFGYSKNIEKNKEILRENLFNLYNKTNSKIYDLQNLLSEKR